MASELKATQAFLYSNVEPDSAQKERFERFLKKKYEEDYQLVWVRDASIPSGFKLVAGSDAYDWTREGRFAQLKNMLSEVAVSRPDDGRDIITLFRTSLDEWVTGVIAEEEGVVLSVGDGIARAAGLENVAYGEIVLFETGITGMVQDLRPDSTGIILFGDEQEVMEGSTVRRTKRTAGIPVGEGFLGRVVNALGEPIDGGDPITADDYRAIESPAPGIIDRQAVDTPMQTGILTIDSMFPIGRGQRELIIGDRQTGKTAIAIDTILNQKDTGVICIYVAIGQRAGSIAQLVSSLKKAGAMDHCIVVSASASEAASIQYIAPYAGTSLGEYFMNKGKDVLIIYDDLSKHAIAYRALSLLLERSPGREAYPGDVFYLHSRLLERSAHLSDARGGGSMTALPIVETQGGDVSAYIPTNIISITDGQIFLESGLFFSGQRPAVNVGLSVSRVGGAAQRKAMKKACGNLRLSLAQYREMEVFTKFSNDLDDVTKRRLVYGQGLMRLLRQPQARPWSLHQQVILLVAATEHILQDIPLEDIPAFRLELLSYIEKKYESLCQRVDETGELLDEDRNRIVTWSKAFLETYEKEHGIKSTE